MYSGAREKTILATEMPPDIAYEYPYSKYNIGVREPLENKLSIHNTTTFKVSTRRQLRSHITAKSAAAGNTKNTTAAR